MTDESNSDSLPEDKDSSSGVKPDPRKEERGPKRLLTHQLPSNRLSLETTFELLRAYAAGSHDGTQLVSVLEAAQLARIHESTPSLLNSFFVDAGLLTREGKKYRPARELLEYQTAHNFDAATAARKLIPVLQRSWTWTALRPRLAMGSISREEAIAALAEAAKATKEDRPRLEALIEFLSACGILVPADGGRFQGPSGSEHLPANGERSSSEPPSPPRASPPSGGETWAALLLKKFPDFDPTWPDELKKSWFAAFDDLMKRGDPR